MDEKKLINDINYYVEVNKKILKIVGLYPVNLLRYGTCFFVMLVIVVPQIFQLYFVRKDFSLIIETCSVLSTIILAILKSLIWLWNSKTSKIVGFMMSDYWRVAEAFDTNNLMQQYAKSGRDVTRGYCFLIINALFVFFAIKPLQSVFLKYGGKYSENSKSFPFLALYPKFCYESPFYEMAYASQILASGVCGLIILATDTIIATGLLHTSGHFNILRDNLSRLDFYFDQIELLEGVKDEIFNSNRIETTYEKTAELKNLSMSLRNRMATLVQHHQLVIRFSDDMDEAFNPIMLMQVLASSLIICFVGFQVTAAISEYEKLLEYSSYLVMAMFQILLFCWPGEELIFQSSMIAHAVFSTNWYKASKVIKTEISLMILRSQKPSHLTAGKFYVMCMENFNAILSTSMSYFTLVRSANLD